jgi:hypothetical protein
MAGHPAADFRAGDGSQLGRRLAIALPRAIASLCDAPRWLRHPVATGGRDHPLHILRHSG